MSLTARERCFTLAAQQRTRGTSGQLCTVEIHLGIMNDIFMLCINVEGLLRLHHYCIIVVGVDKRRSWKHSSSHGCGGERCLLKLKADQ
jgi:hypothetical protein